ncbi:MAG: rRNA maturation RNase YbeY [Xanthomonadales bacterium]|nr:rRNA maturation RNase YbeY [Xanthomonadales bacterium]
MNKASFEISVETDGAPESQALAGFPVTDWCINALRDFVAGGGVDIRIVDEPEMSATNRQYRGREGPTNVLSFPAELHPDVESPLLGDLLICAPLVEREAREQGKSTEDHLAHLVTHGALHLLGYDHENDEDAAGMEAEEARLLARIGVSNPYQLSGG